MNDRELEKLLLTGATQVEMVTIPGPNNTMEQVSIERGNFFMLQQVAFQLQQVNLRLEALHQHVRVKEHPRGAGRSTCPLCIAMDQVSEGDANVVAGNVGASASVQEAPPPDPEGDIKADIEKAKEADARTGEI